MLPWLRPRTFYDLVIKVAIIGPSPIQGGMIHLYLRGREGAEPVTYPSDKIQGVLARTPGIPIFQEQVMQITIGGDRLHRRRSRPVAPHHGGVEA